MSAKRHGAKVDQRGCHCDGTPLGARRRGLASTLGHWLAAYLVVLQAVLAGLAAGAMAAPGAADAFPLCLSATSDGGTTADHGGTAPARVFHDCNACPLAGGTPVLLGIPAVEPPRAFDLAQAIAPAVTRAVAPVPLFESARPRAPPSQG